VYKYDRQTDRQTRKHGERRKDEDKIIVTFTAFAFSASPKGGAIEITMSHLVT